MNGRYTKKVPLWAVLIRYYLSPKRVIIEYNLPKRAFDQVVERIKQVFYESLVHPNQNIGSISGQSLGEVLTQMTLNSFHSAGLASAKTSTSGVPLLKELLTVT